MTNEHKERLKKKFAELLDVIEALQQGKKVKLFRDSIMSVETVEGINYFTSSFSFYVAFGGKRGGTDLDLEKDNYYFKIRKV